MLDPIPPSAYLQQLVTPIAERLSFQTLPLHAHEVILSFIFYQSIQSIISPFLSRRLFAKHYNAFNTRTRINWDVHVVSLTQSTLICILALWVMWTDRERWAMDSRERVYGYSGACGMIQGFAAGYFLWDLVISTVHFKTFGLGLWLHAVSALWVFSFGFRPFINYYAPTFILYELSSPFLNFHWFFDKVNMTGSKAQWYNGMALLSSFFACRLVWGTYQSFIVFSDIFGALNAPPDAIFTPKDVSGIDVFGGGVKDGALCIDESCVRANAEVLRFANSTTVPVWLAFTYLGSNLILNALNWYWYGKMIETVLKRFRTPKTDDKVDVAALKDADLVFDAAGALKDEHSGDIVVPADVVEKVSGSVEAIKEEARRRRKA